MNVLSSQTIESLSEHISLISKNKDIRVLIITGGGDRAFCAGADIKELSELEANVVEDYVKKGTNTYNQIEKLDIPVIAAINGYAFGAGFELTLACDLRFISDKAMMGQPAAKHGLFPPFGGVHRLPAIVGSSRAKEIFFSASYLNPEECFNLKLVNKIFQHEILLQESIKFAEKICLTKRYAISMIKDVLNKESYNQYLIEEQDQALIECLRNPETKIQLASFFKKK